MWVRDPSAAGRVPECSAVLPASYVLHVEGCWGQGGCEIVGPSRPNDGERLHAPRVPVLSSAPAGTRVDGFALGGRVRCRAPCPPGAPENRDRDHAVCRKFGGRAGPCVRRRVEPHPTILTRTSSHTFRTLPNGLQGGPTRRVMGPEGVGPGCRGRSRVNTSQHQGEAESARPRACTRLKSGCPRDAHQRVRPAPRGPSG